MALVVLEVADDHGGLLEPGHQAQGREVRDHVEVAVAELPIGEFVAGDGLHLHVDGEQVIAAVGAVPGGALEEEVGIEALAHEAAVEIGEDHQHGVDIIFTG